MSVTPEEIEKYVLNPNREEPKPDIKESIDYASRKNPDQFAEDYSRARDLGIPIDVSERQRAEALRLQTLREVGVPDEIAQQNPGTADYLSDPQNAVMSFDEIRGLRSYEKILADEDRSVVMNTLKGGLNRINELTGNLIEVIGRQADDFDSYMNEIGIPSPGITIGDDGISFHWDLPEDKRTSIEKIGTAISEGKGYDYQPTFTWENLKGDLTVQNLAGYIFEQGVQSLPDMAAAIFTLPAYITSRTEEIAETRVENDERKEVTNEDLAKSLVPALAVSLVERWAGKIVFSKTGAKTVGGIAAKTAEGMLVEGSTEFIQEGIEYVGERYGTKKEMSAAEALDRMFAGMVAGAGMGGTIKGATATAEVVAHKLTKKATNRVESIRDQQIIDSTNSFAQSSVTRERSVEHFKKFMDSVGKDRNVLIDPINIPPEVIPLLPENIRDQIDGTGADVTIPLSQYATDIAPNQEITDAIRPFIKLDDSTRLSQSELEVADQSDIEKLIEKAQKDQDVLTEAEAIFEDVKNQLVSTGIQSETTARFSAQLYPAVATTFVQRARKKGKELSVMEAYQMMGLNIIPDADPARNAPSAGVYAQERRKPRALRRYPEGTEVSVGEPFSETLDLAPGQVSVSFGKIIGPVDKLRTLVQFSDGEQREVYNQYIEPTDENVTYFQSAQKNDIGLYSQVEQAVLDMNHPAWKQDKPAPGNEIWSKIKNAPGVKKEEIEWLDLQNFLTATPKAKFTRDQVISYIQLNGINIEETIAEETEPEVNQEFDWSESIDDDSENWYWRVEEYMYEYDRTDWTGMDSEFHFIDEEDWFEKLDEEVEEMVQGEDEYLATLEPELQTAIKQYKNALHMQDVAQVQDVLPGVEEVDWEQQFEEAQETLRDEVSSFDSVRRWFEDKAEESAREEYEDNPIKEWYDETTGITIRGNDDYGYRVSDRRTDIGEYSNWSDAETAAFDRALDYDLFGEAEVDVPEEQIVKWKEYVMDGSWDSYREIKLTLPDVADDFYATSHFPDRNILAFLRVTDRTLTGKFPSSKEIKFLEDKARAIAAEGIVSPDDIDFTSPDIPLDYYVQLPEGRLDEDRMMWARVENYAEDEARMGAGTWFQDTVAQASKIWADLSPEQRKEHYTQGYEKYISDKIDKVKVKGEPLNTFFIDEFQSDWHNQGRKNGYQMPSAKLQELREQKVEVEEELDTIFYKALKLADVSNVVKVDEDSDIILKDGTLVTKAQLFGYMEELFNQRDVVGAMDSRKSLEYAGEILNLYGQSQGIDDIFKFGWELANKKNKLARDIAEGTKGAPDVPYKNEGWQQLGMKRAILHAIEQGYEAIGWPNTRILTDRWSSSYREMYNIQYMQNMPKIAKKLMKEQPIHVDMNGKMLNPKDGERERGYWVIPITDDLRRDVQEKGFSLFQQTRASVQFTIDDQSIIRLSRASDLSSFLHESGHIFLEMERRFMKVYGADDQVRTLMKWLDVDSLDDLTTEHHEKFAETFEVYLREGKAPSLRLRDAFAAFARWLTHIYRKLTDPRLGRAELTPEIKEYMDRLLATEAELEQAKANPIYDEFFASKQQAGMAEKEWEKYQERKEKRDNKAAATLIDVAIGELRKRKSKEWKEEKAPLIEEEKERLSKTTPYQILSDLKHTPMDYDLVLEALNVDKQPPKLIGKLKKGGMDPEDYRDVYGYRTVKEMIDHITTVPSLSKAAAEAAEARMVQKYGDVLNDGTLELEAREALHNEDEAQLLIQELRALNRKAPTIDREYLKAKAKEAIERMKYKEIKPNKYYSAEVRAAQRAVTAATPEEKTKYKIQQLANHYLYKEAMSVKDRMIKQRRYVKTVQTREYKSNQVDPYYSQNMRTLAHLYELRNKPEQLKSITDVLGWYNTQLVDPNKFVEVSLLDPNLVVAWEMYQSGKISDFVDQYLPTFDDLTSSELQGLYEMLRHMRYVGGKIAESNRADINAEINELSEWALEKGGRDYNIQRGVPVMGESFMRQAKVFVNKLLSLRNLVRLLDGGDESGKFYQKVYRAIEDANNRKMELQNQLYDRFKKQMEGINRVGLNRKKYTYTREDGTPLTMTTESRFMMALYWGTQSSREAILKGFNLTETDVFKILQDMSTEELDLVNATWKINESLWPDLSKAAVQLYGVAPPKLEATPFVINGVKMTGGHMRLYYDSTEVEVKQIQDSVGDFAKVMPTKAGSLNARVGSGGRPPRLDKNNITQSLEENIHYIAFAEPSNKLRAFINSDQIKSAVEQKHGPGFYTALLETVDNIAGNRKQRESSSFLASVSRFARQAATARYLMWSVRNSVQQFTAIPIAMQDIGIGTWISHFANYWTNRAEFSQFVNERSKFMENRASLVNREAASYMRKLTLDKVQAGLSKMSELGFSPQTFIDSMIAYPVWMAKYEKSIQEGMSERDASSAADTAVAETVGSGSELHLGGLFSQNNAEYVKMFTMFGTWFNAYYNRIQRAKIKGDYFELAMTAAVMPFIVGTASAWLVHDFPQSDDEDEWAKWTLKNWAEFMAGTMPLARDMAGAIGGFTPKPAYSGLVETPAQAINLIENFENKTPLKAASNTLKIVSTFAPVPGAGNFTRFMDYTDSWMEGNEGTEFSIWQSLVEGKERNK